MQKELGTQEAQRVQTEENVSETMKKMMSSEEGVSLYKSQVIIFFLITRYWGVGFDCWTLNVERFCHV